MKPIEKSTQKSATDPDCRHTNGLREFFELHLVSVFSRKWWFLGSLIRRRKSMLSKSLCQQEPQKRSLFKRAGKHFRVWDLFAIITVSLGNRWRRSKNMLFWSLEPNTCLISFLKSTQNAIIMCGKRTKYMCGKLMCGHADETYVRTCL